MERTAQPLELIAGLAMTLARVSDLGLKFTDEELRTAPEAGAWSANEILWHIRAAADVYGEHIARILKEDAPRWRHISPRARMKKVRYDELPFTQSSTSFANQRVRLLERVTKLRPEAWERAALVTVQGRETRLTLRERIWGMVNHEEIHCAEMQQVAAAIAGRR